MKVAQQILDAVRENFGEIPNVVVHVVEDFSVKLRVSGLMFSTHRMLQFARSFTKCQPRFNMVDIDSDIMRLRTKLQHNLNSHLSNPSRKHVYVGGSEDEECKSG